MPQRITHRRRAAPLAMAVRTAIAVSIAAPLAGSVLRAQTLPTPAAVTPATPAAPSLAPPPTHVTERPTGPITLEGLPILRVEVIGNTRTDSHLITDQIRSQPGQNYSRQQTDVDVRSIASLDRFITVRAEVVPVAAENSNRIRGVDIRFIVEERPSVTGVEITGNRLFSDAVIRDALISKGNGPVDPFSIETDRKTIVDMYRKRGYDEASVYVNPDLVKQGIIRYQITEGPRGRITAIRFDGNAHVNSDYLKFKIQTKTSFWFFRKGVLNDEKLQQDLVTIRDIYQKRGFLDARVAYYLDYSDDKSKIALRFAIVEGPQYKIAKINVSGNTVFSTAQLLGDLSRFGPGSYAERDHIDALQKRIENAYGHQGYINRDVVVTLPYTETPGYVNLDIKITENTPFIVGQIIVRGNANIQDRVIRRQVRIYPDQTYDTVLVQRSIDRLKSLHIFSDAKITPIGDEQGVRDALVEVAEGQTGSFRIGAGVSSNSGLVGQISLEQQNFDITNTPKSLGEFLRGQSFKGAGQYFKILLEPGTEFQQYRVSFEEPYLFDTPYSLSNDIYYFTRARESWNERRIGDTVTLGHRFNDVWAISLSARAEQVSITGVQDANNNGITDTSYFIRDPSSGQPFGPFGDSAQEVLDNQGSKFLTSIKPAIARDTTDSKTFPTSGSRSALSIEQYGAFGGDVTFTKLVLRYDKYISLYEDLFERKTVLALRNEVGFDLFGDAPFYERFYGGGIGSLRGFKFRGVGPRSGPLSDPVGGDFSWVSTVEVNYPIWENLLRGVVFTDVGTVEKDITIDSIRSDVGFGFRIKIPFFGDLPLALDFALPVTKASGDKKQILSFALAIPF